MDRKDLIMVLTRSQHQQESTTKPKPRKQSTEPISITTQAQLTKIKDQHTDYDVSSVYYKYRTVSRHLSKRNVRPRYSRLMPYINDQYVENLTIKSSSFNAGGNLIYLNFGRSLFENCVFVNCALTYTNLRNITFINCTFTDCTFTDCNLRDVDFVECRMENTAFCGCDMTSATVYRTTIYSGGFMFSNFRNGAIQESTLASTTLKNCNCSEFTLDSNKTDDFVMSDCVTDNVVRFYETEAPIFNNLQNLKLRATTTSSGNIIGYLPATSQSGPAIIPAIIQIKILCQIEEIGSDKDDMYFVRADQFAIMNIVSLAGYPLQSADTIIERVYSSRNDGRYIHFFLLKAECMKFM